MTTPQYDHDGATRSEHEGSTLTFYYENPNDCFYHYLFYDQRQSLLLANQILVILFIVAIIATNVELLYRYFRAPGLLYRPNRLIKMSLAFGSLFLALYSDVIKVVALYYTPNWKIYHQQCPLVLSGDVYTFMILPFVYGGCIITQGFHLYLKQTRCNLYRNAFRIYPRMLSLITTIVPWLLGLTIVAGYFISLYIFSKHQKMFITIPAFCPMVCIVAFQFIIKSEDSPSSDGTLDTSQANIELYNNARAEVSSLNENHQQPEDAEGEMSPFCLMTIEMIEAANMTSQNVSTEKRALLIACVIYSICLLPEACLQLVYYFSDDLWKSIPSEVYIIVKEVINCLFHLYPCTIPLVWRRQL